MTTLLLVLGLLAADLPPRAKNARVETRSAAAGLARVFEPLARAPGPQWIGYAVPVRGRHQMCCHRSTDEIGTVTPGCRLEGDGAYTLNIDDDGTARLEEDRDFLVLYRVEGGRVDRIRTLSRDCGLDFGGRPLHWLTDVRPAESLELLASMVGIGVGPVKKKAKGGMGEPAISAIALHDDPAADTLLERFVQPGQEIGVRKQAAFWLGNTRGRRGYAVLRRMVTSDADPEFREHAVFALSQSEEPGALDAIIAVARGDRDPEVRGHALFWLGQKAGRAAAGAITRAIEEDPETEVKKKAVFALSQLPKDESVPLLIDLARKNRNPAVRKQAMFWLGQSGDPRALAFFEDVLGR
jgi:hypothetical protein